MSDSQNIDLRSSTSLLSIWKEYHSTSNFSLYVIRICTDFSQCSLRTQKRVHSAHSNPEIRIRIFCFLPSFMSAVSSFSSERLSIAIVIECSMHARRNFLFFGPFAVMLRLLYQRKIAFISSPYDDTSTRHHSFFPVLRIAGEVFTFMTV